MGKKKTKGVNRSQEIRDYLAEHPNAPVKEIIEALGKRGIQVSQGLVSNVKYTSGPKRRGRRKKKRAVARRSPRKRTTATRRGTSGISASDLIEAKKLADQLGGIREARQALDALEELR